MSDQELVSVPGKVILFGEHAVVYPVHTAVILPMPGVSCTVKDLTDGITTGVRVVEKKAGLDCRFSFNELQEYLDQSVTNYRKFQETSDMTSLHAYKQPQKYIKLVIAIVAKYVMQHGTGLKPVSFELSSSIPVGGLGSSAAVAAGLIQAFALCHDLNISSKNCYELTLRAEQFQHGRPSGADVAAIVYNQPVCVRKNPDSKATASKLQPDIIGPGLLRHCYVLYTGLPRQSTAELIAHVRQQYPYNSEIIENIETNTRQFLQSIKESSLNEAELVQLINTNGRLLEKLEVVTEVGRIIGQTVRQAGGAAKVSGAGGMNKGPCGAMILYLKDKPLLRELRQKYRIYPMLKSKA